jgi:hypothetical protein
MTILVMAGWCTAGNAHHCIVEANLFTNGHNGGDGVLCLPGAMNNVIVNNMYHHPAFNYKVLQGHTSNQVFDLL